MLFAAFHQPQVFQRPDVVLYHVSWSVAAAVSAISRGLRLVVLVEFWAVMGVVRRRRRASPVDFNADRRDMIKYGVTGMKFDGMKLLERLE